MQARLIVIAGPDQGCVFLLTEQQTLIIGRNQSLSSPLTDLCVTRRHGQVEADGGRFFLTDVGSRSGTYVNGRVVRAKHELKPGDVIRIGQTELRFQLDGADEAGLSESGDALPARSV